MRTGMPCAKYLQKCLAVWTLCTLNSTSSRERWSQECVGLEILSTEAIPANNILQSNPTHDPEKKKERKKSQRYHASQWEQPACQINYLEMGLTLGLHKGAIRMSPGNLQGICQSTCTKMEKQTGTDMIQRMSPAGRGTAQLWQVLCNSKSTPKTQTSQDWGWS